MGAPGAAASMRGVTHQARDMVAILARRERPAQLAVSAPSDAAPALPSSPDASAVGWCARGQPPARVVLAWLLGKAGVTAPIVGATKPNHVDDAVAALDLRLDPEEITELEGPTARTRSGPRVASLP